MKDQLVVEFFGTTLFGNSVVAGSGLRRVGSFFELSSGDKGKVLIIDKLSVVVVLKAEVLGVVAIVTRDGPTDLDDGRIKISLPIMSLKSAEFDKLILEDLERVKKVTLDTDSGKLSLEV